ncbi:hypothetical protein H2203_008624 [Taxawa tesnikishii (nom. ined.)]|nr:hypothetical protein H2203_008624 [Dothideales sp. JES 119]
MSSLSAYTPLESLLLFQALHADGVASLSFNAISDQLRSIPLIRNDATYDTARLSPGALKNFYLGLLKDEAKRDLENERGDKEDAHNGHLSPGSRKRKAPSPSLPTLVEAARQSHLIPRLVQRLYAGYREKVAAEIEEDEARYDALSREIQDIERGEWDERLRSQHGADGYRPGANVQDDKGRAAANGDLPLPPPRSAEASPRIGQTARGTPSARAHQATIDAVINHGPDTVAGGGSPHQRNSITALPPLSEMAPESPRPFSRPPSQHAHSPQLPQSLPPGAGYRHSPPVSHQPPYAPPYPRPAVAQGPSPSPKLQNALNGLSPSSPRPMLPLPAGMKFAPIAGAAQWHADP